MEKKLEGPVVDLELDGVKVQFYQDPHISSVSGYYEVDAWKIGEDPEDPIYTVYWKISGPTDDDESDTCDWDSPVAIKGPGGWIAGTPIY